MIRGPFDIPPTATKLAYRNQEGSRNVFDEMRATTAKMAESNGKVKDQVTRYREMARFNKRISTSYYDNLQVVIDVSKLLQAHIEMFEEVKRSVQEMQEALGSPLDIEEFTYLGNLTKDSLNQLSNEFYKSTEDLKSLYVQFGDQDKATKIARMQQQFSSTPNDVGRMIRSINQKPSASGSRYNTKTTPAVPSDTLRKL